MKICPITAILSCHEIATINLTQVSFKVLQVMSQKKFIEDAGRAIWAHWGQDATAPPEDRKVVRGELTEAMEHIKATTGKISNIMEAVLDTALLDRDSAGARNGVLAWIDFVEELDKDYPELAKKWPKKLQGVTKAVEKKQAASEAAA